MLFGLGAALFWGLGDYLITLLTRLVGTTRALVAIQLLSLLAWIVYGVLGGFGAPVGENVWLLAFLAGACHVFGLVFTYKAFEIGTLSIVSPIASGFAIVTAVLAFASGERPGAVVAAGTLLLILGVVLVSRSVAADEVRSFRGVPHAIGSAVGFGVMFWLFFYHVQPSFEHVQPELKYVSPLVVLKVMASAYAVGALALRRPTSADGESEIARVAPTFMRIAPLAVGAALADTAAWLSYIYGTERHYVSVVTALASLFSAFTVFLAWMFLKERLRPHQWAGVIAILVGVLLVSLPT